jgi:hypothetical protein
MKKIPRKLNFAKTERLEEDYSGFGYEKFIGLYVIIRMLFVLIPKRTAWRVLCHMVQALILCIAITENILSFLYFDKIAFQSAAEVSHFIRVVTAYIFMIHYLRKPLLLGLLRKSYNEKPRETVVMVNMYLWAYGACVFIQVGGAVPFFLALPEDIRVVGALIASRIVQSLIWIASLLILWINVHLLTNHWKQFHAKLMNGQFYSVGEALVEHAKLTESLSQLNKLYEVYLVITCTVLITSLISGLYASLKERTNISIWVVGFVLDCVFLFCLCLPGSRVTTMAKRVKKAANKLRALTDPEDEKAIREIDSFLLYLITNNASFKIAGVSIDLGFTTKFCIAIFSVCAFMVQRELA